MYTFSMVETNIQCTLSSVVMLQLDIQFCQVTSTKIKTSSEIIIIVSRGQDIMILEYKFEWTLILTDSCQHIEQLYSVWHNRSFQAYLSILIVQ